MNNCKNCKRCMWYEYDEVWDEYKCKKQKYFVSDPKEARGCKHYKEDAHKNVTTED